MPEAPPAAAGSTIRIRGFGLVTSLGHSAWQSFRALLAGRQLTDRAAALPAEVDMPTRVRLLGGVSIGQHARQDPVIDLAERAAREALAMAGVEAEGLGCLLGTSKGAMHALAAAAEEFRVPGFEFRGGPAATGTAEDGRGTQTRNSKLETRNADLALAVALGPHGYVGHHLRERLGLKWTRTVVAACASGLTAVHAARQLLLDPNAPGRPRRVLVVSAEASLLPMFVRSYERLGVLAPEAGYQCRPLDERRRGFVLAEQAAAVVLEREEGQGPRGKGQGGGEDIELLDTAIGSESYDLIRPAPAMAALEHVARKLLCDRAIDLLHPHATGTADQDAIELAAYGRVLAEQFRAASCGFREDEAAAARGGGRIDSATRNAKLETRNCAWPEVYACKGALGHGLGAAGLVALVLACLCARTGRRPPMPWLEQPLDSPLLRGRDLVALAGLAGGRGAPTTHAVFAAGFGGHVAGAVLRG